MVKSAIKIMTDLSKQIEILLLDNDCVIVPGFGGFMAHHVNSLYVEEENLFLPPSRTLGFNPQLHVNDSLLAQSYVEAYDISYPEAIRRIEDDVREVKQALANDGEYELPDIGVIVVNKDGKYEFTPCSAGILTPEFYALNSFEMPLLKDPGNKVVAENKAETKKEKKQKAVSNVDDSTVEEERHEENSSARIYKLSTDYVRNIAVAAILLAMFVFASMPIGDGTKENRLMCSIDTSLLQTIMPQVKTITKEEFEPIVPQIEEPNVAEVTETVTEVVAETETAAKDMFVIVLASKVSKANGEAFISKLKNYGISDARLIKNGTSNKVVCGNFANEEDARSKANEMRYLSDIYADVWVMKTNE